MIGGIFVQRNRRVVWQNQEKVAKLLHNLSYYLMRKHMVMRQLIYNTTGRTAQEWQELLCYDILAVNKAVIGTKMVHKNIK